MDGIVLENLKKNYGDLPVVKGINLEIQEKEFVVLVGPSGCGKSTTLRMIAGLEEISDGTISIENTIVNKVSPKERNIAMVFQNYALYPHLSVYENMAFSLKLSKRPKDKIDSAINEAANILGLEELLERKPSELSGGQRQRVAMGRAIVRRPKVFLFDEPLSNLDARLRSVMRKEIKELHKKIDTTIVYVTHDQVEAMTLADKIVVMNNGHIEQVGSPLDVYQNPSNTFVASFLGSPPMNLICSKANNGALQFGNATFNTNHENIIIGIRPEKFHYANTTDTNSSINLNIGLIEPLGADHLVHGGVDGQDLIAKLPGELNLDGKDSIELFFNNEDLHFFDSNTKQVTKI